MAYGYIAKLNENVERKHVRFNNRFGIAVAADLYTSKELDVSQKYIPIRTGYLAMQHSHFNSFHL